MPSVAIETPSAFDASTPEFSRLLRLDEITNDAMTVSIEATPAECAMLAQRFDLPHIRDLSAQITYRRARGGQMIRVQGHLSAAYGQLCSASQAMMAMSAEETFQTEYTLSAWEKFSEFDLEQPEIMTDDFLDIGEIAAQYFTLSIDPYARRADMETLAELASNLTAAARDLTAAQASPAVVAPANAHAMPRRTSELENLLTEPEAENLPRHYVNENDPVGPGLQGATIEFEWDDVIAEELIWDGKGKAAAAATQETRAPEAAAPNMVDGGAVEVKGRAPERVESQPGESLFFKHLRRIRAA